MSLFPPLLALFVLVPLIEIYLLIRVGGLIGAGWTVFLVVATAFLGAMLVRAQGLATVARIRSQLDHGTLPALELLEGLFLLIAGALLLTPGFFTDAIGFACLIPPLRRALIRAALDRGLIREAGRGPPAGGDTGRRTIEGEFRHIDD